ncbi:MAG: methionyl-tRNA formyltransferase [Patescibacteria group bacterium]
MQLKDAKVIFMGTSLFAREVLKDLLEKNTNIDLVITQPDRPAGRKKTLQSPDVKNLALEEGLNLKQFSELKEEEIDFIKKQSPDLIIVASYGLIIPEKVLDIPRFGCVNIHPSLLPNLRGPSPIQTALWQNLKKTGVTFIKMTPGIDAGPIFFQKSININPDDIYPVLKKKLINLTKKFLTDSLEKYLNNKVVLKEQDHQKATLTKLITKKDGRIFWSSPAEEIYNKFRAFYGWPGIYSFIKTERFYKKISFWEISYRQENPEEKDLSPGKVFEDSKNQVAIKTGKGIVIPLEIQLEGKKSMSIKDFTNGQPNFTESLLE